VSLEDFLRISEGYLSGKFLWGVSPEGQTKVSHCMCYWKMYLWDS